MYRYIFIFFSSTRTKLLLTLPPLLLVVVLVLLLLLLLLTQLHETLGIWFFSLFFLSLHFWLPERFCYEEVSYKLCKLSILLHTDSWQICFSIVLYGDIEGIKLLEIYWKNFNSVLNFWNSFLKKAMKNLIKYFIWFFLVSNSG